MENNTNILIVDDREENLLALEGILDLPNISLIKATSGEMALEKLLSHEIALTILDVQMPGMDGFETATLMRGNKITREIPIIFVTAISKEDQHLFKGYESGAVDYLFKPVSPTILRSKVAIFLELHQQKNRLKIAKDKLTNEVELRKQAEKEKDRLIRELQNTLAEVKNEISERMRAEEELKEANRELDTFVYTVSHDLRSPLTPIISYADYLCESCRDRLEEQELGCLAEISDSGKRMVALMEDLLTLAKVGQVERPSEQLDTGAVVNDAICDLTEELSGAGVGIEVADLPSLSVPKTLLYQIFHNLIGNALRYAGREGSPIEVGGERRDDLVRFYVRDHGPGIPEEERSQIFEVFYRGTTGKESPGTGVGLATVQKIARLYGNRAWVEETPGGGSTFWVEMVDVETAAENEVKSL